MGAVCCCSTKSSDQGNRSFLSASVCTQTFQSPGKHLLGEFAVAGVRFVQLIPDRAVVETPRCDEDPTGELWGETWLGKSASSLEEIEFYDLAVRLRDTGPAWRVINYFVDYRGMLHSFDVRSTKADQPDLPMDLLVFRSPLECLAVPRVLSFEIGPWASLIQCNRQTDVEIAMSVRQDGVQVEGFMNPPVWIATESATQDAREWSWGDTKQRRAKRLPLRELPVGDAFAAFVDMKDAIAEEKKWFWESTGLHEESPSRSSSPKSSSPKRRISSLSNKSWATLKSEPVDTFSDQFLVPAEYSELALLTMVRELAELVQACCDVPVPQKWIGSSIAFFADVGAAPPRSRGGVSPEDWVRARMSLKLFGWSRSWLRAPGHMTAKQWVFAMEEHDNLWTIYQNYLFWSLWEAARLYFHTFGGTAWENLRIEVYHKNLSGPSNLIGMAVLALPSSLSGSSGDSEQQQCTMRLVGGVAGSQVFDNNGHGSEVSISVSYCECPLPSRLRGVMHVVVHSAVNLPISKEGGSDTFAVVVAQESSDSRTMRRRTRAVLQSLDPEWQEEFHFPVAQRRDGALRNLHEAIRYNTSSGHGGGLSRLLPPPTAHEILEHDITRNKTEAQGQVAFMKEIKAGWTAASSEPTESANDELPHSGNCENFQFDQ